MFSQNNDLQKHFLDSIDLFAASSQNLETKTLSEIFCLIQEVYSLKDNDLRKEKEIILKNLRNSENWKRYVLHIFQIICFLDVPQKETLERLAFEASTTVEKLSSLNKDNINMEELITLLAANLYILLNKEFPVKVLSFLARSLKNLFQVGIFEKSNKFFFFY